MTKHTQPTALSESEAIRSFRHANIAMVLTDPNLEDNPIVYANAAFERVTGYSSSGAVGRNCRFLQGDETNAEARARLRAAIEAREEITVELRNVRADGTPFLNRLLVAPILHDGQCSHFLGLQMEVAEGGGPEDKADRQLRELQHRVKNHLAMIIALIRHQSHESQSPQEFQALARRIESLQLLYEELVNGGDDGDDEVPMGSYLSRIASTIGHLDGRAGIRMQVEIETVTLPLDQATSIGLVLSEMLTNAFQHAFEGRDTGQVEVRVTRLSDQALRLTVSDDGVGLPEGCRWPEGDSLGGRLVRSFLTSMDASLDVRRGGTGTIVTVDVPAQLKRG